MDRQILDQLSTGRVRRDVQALRDALAAVTPGDAVRIVIRSPRHGLYIVEGEVRLGAGGTPQVAGTALAATSEVQAVHVLPGVEPAAESDPATAAPSLAHGALVRVSFTETAYGTFHVSGPLTAGTDAFLLVGPWIVRDGGAIAPRVVGVEVVDDLEIHPANVPPRRPALDDSGAPIADAGV